MSDAVVDFNAPNEIPIEPTVKPAVEIPSILKVRDEALVRKTFVEPLAPV
jgi:hypothetical protein